MSTIAWSAELIEAFAGTFLSPMYDEAKPTPDLHREGWGLYCSAAKLAAIAAPREHAKSTAFTHDYTLANVLFRQEDYVILVSANEEMAIEHLSDIAKELRDNEDLIKEFRIKRFVVDAKTDIIVEMDDGHQFRIIARGSGQKMRGRKWRGKRPGLIVCHKKGTRIVDQGREMLVEEHPTAQIVKREGYTVEVHGLPFFETVTPEHRYWTRSIRQKKCAEYKGGVKVRNYTEYIRSTPGWQEAWLLDGKYWIGHPIDTEQLAWGADNQLFSGDFWWLLGLWWGDGTANPEQNQVSWYVANKDRDTVGARIVSFFNLHGIYVSESQRPGCVSMTITHWGLSRLLKDWSFGNSQKKAPAWVLKLPFEQQADIVRGYIAADGWVDQTTQQVRLTSVCYPALFQVRQMLARLGIVATIRQGKFACETMIQGRLCKCQTKYDLMFRDGASKLGYDIEDSSRYTLKRVFIADGFIWSQVKSTFKVASQEFVPIQTESHTYTTDFGLSHNCDDLEDDEQVESLDRRIKFRRWFFRALKPALRDGGKLRVHGTILHEDSLLARLMKDRTWTTLFYKAHAGFDDFTDILWPEKFPESRLREIRQTFIEQGDAPGYSQEYLNDPFDNSEAYLRRADFIAMDEVDRREPKIFCAGVDFAISKADKANRTSITVGGKCTRNLISVVDQRKGRWDSLEIMDEMIAVQQRWGIDVWFVENGQIWKAISPMLYREMQRRDVWLNIFALNPVKDKAVRGRPYQAKHRAGGMRFDKEADWYPSYEAENLRFTGTGDATQDDQFDSTALMVKGFDQLADIDEEDFQSEEEAEMIAQDPRNYEGRNAVTGY